MMKTLRHLILVTLACGAFFSCAEEPRNVEELVDPWLRERTPISFKLESQIGAAVITSDWRDDTTGNIVVSIVTGGLDISAVEVVELKFEFDGAEYAPVSSIKVGDKVDLSSGSTSFVVTAASGEKRTYTLSYEPFIDPIEGVYDFNSHCCWVYGGNMASWGGTHVMAFDEKSWNFPNYNYGWEDDNTLTIVCTGADAETGDTWGTIDNNAGEDGLYASFATNNWGNLSNFYRCIPCGEGTYYKTFSTGEITFKGSYTDADGAKIDIEKKCFIWEAGSHGPLATLYADDLEHGGADSKTLNIGEGSCAFAFKIPSDTPGLAILNETSWNDKDKFALFPKYFFTLATKRVE